MNLSQYAMEEDDDRPFVGSGGNALNRKEQDQATSQPEKMHKLFKCKGVEGNRVKKASAISSDDS